MNLQYLKDKVCDIAIEVGDFIKEECNNFNQKNIEIKSKNSLVSYVDKTAEKRIVAFLETLLPAAGFIAEEGTSDKEGEHYNWIIDPLDGTTNFMHGIPTYSISIALKFNNEIVNRKKNDNILIYYAGHGQLVKKQKRGYWLPTDAGSSQDSKWLSNNSIKDLIGSSDAKHILLIVYSCFSGSLMRGSGENKSVEKLTKTSIERLQKKKTRLVMTSGGNEQVADGIGNSKNSVFAEPLIKALKDNNSVIRSIELFQTVQSYVINNADQTPNHSLIHGTGHNGGEFLFFPKS